MEPDRWRQVVSLVQSALERPAAERAEFLKQASAGDEPLAREVQLLLDAEQKSGSFLETSAIDKAAGGLGSQIAQPAEVPDPLIGRTMSHYRVVERIGGGGMGVVYKAEDTRLGRVAALKFLSGEIQRDRQALIRFQREARAASALNHPNIVTIYDIGEAEGRAFIAMELIDGRTIRSLAAESLPIEKLGEMAAQAARALAAAHEAGIVHRDIKPENIMVREDGYVKILDFGLARIVLIGSSATAKAETEEITSSGVIAGTLRYMSPEQARGDALSPATDIFSLGLVFYELFTGMHPFEAASQLATLHAIVAEPALPLSHRRPGIPPQLDALALGMLEKDARLRPTAAEVHAALASLGRKSSAPAVAQKGSQRRIVGRTKQMQELRVALESAEAGRGSVVCLSGESGLGKTTLVEDFLSGLAQREGQCHVARGRCSERLAGSEAYLPFLEALESLLHGSSAETVARIMKSVAPAWYVQIAPVAESDSSRERALTDARSASQERLKRELAAFVQELARTRPLVLFLDDLHWADNSTVDLLSYIGDRLGSMRVLLIGTYRTSELLGASHPFPHIKLDLQSRGLCRELQLDFLTREDIDAYLALEFPENRFPAEFAEMIYSRTEGNALFIVDMVRYLRARGAIEQKQGVWMVSELIPEIANDLPETVRSMIQRNIDRLSDADRRLMTAASVQGREFDSAVVATVLALDAGDVEERLQILDRVHGLVRFVGERELPDGTLTLRYTFVHVLYENALYSSITASRKVSLSAAIGQALVDCYRERSAEIAAQLALLFEAARDFGRASEHFISAGRNAVHVSANHEAIALFQRAIRNAEKLRDESRPRRIYDAALELGRIFETLTRPNDSADAFRLAAKAAEEMNDPGAEVHAICGLGVSLFYAKRMKECAEECDRAYDVVARHNLAEMIPAVDTVRFLERVSAGDFNAAETHSGRALAALRDADLLPEMLPGMNFRAGLHVWRLEDREAERILDWTMKEARELGVRSRILQNFFFRTISLGHRGRLGDALNTLEEAQRMAEMNGERFVLARIPNTLGWLHREMLDLEGALELDLEGIKLAQQVGDKEAEFLSHVNAGQIYMLGGDHDRAYERFQVATSVIDQMNWFNWLFRTRLEWELGSYWLARGDLSRAEAHASTSLDIARRALCRKHLAWGLKLKGDIAVADDRMQDGQTAYGDALGVLSNYPCPPVEWQIRKSYAALKRGMGDSAGADDELRHARAVVNSLAESVTDERLRRGLRSAV